MASIMHPLDRLVQPSSRWDGTNGDGGGDGDGCTQPGKPRALLMLRGLSPAYQLSSCGMACFLMVRDHSLLETTMAVVWVDNLLCGNPTIPHSTQSEPCLLQGCKLTCRLESWCFFPCMEQRAVCSRW